MRAYVHVTATGATLHLPSTSNRPSDAVAVRVPEHAEPGWYRVSAYFARGWDFAELGRKVDPAKEADRLDTLAAKNDGHARTGSPGVAGYAQRERAASAAMQTQRQINRYFADLLRACSLAR